MRAWWILIGVLASSQLARADASVGAFVVEPTEVAEVVWLRCIGFTMLGGHVDDHLRLWTRGADGAFGRAGMIRYGDLIAVSDTGYHPPTDPGEFNLSTFPVFSAARTHVEIVIDAKTGKSAWVARKDLGVIDLLSGKVGPIAEVVDLVWLRGTTGVTVFSAPGDPKAKRIVTWKEPQNLHVFEFRNGWARVGIHVNPIGTDEPPSRPLGWIRLRDQRGRLTVWPMNRDTC